MANWIRNDVNIDFIGNRRRWWTISTILVVLSILTLVVNVFVRGTALNYGTDFRGGTQIQVEFAKALKTEQVRTTLTKAGYKGAEVVAMSAPGRKNFFMLRLTEVSAFADKDQKRVKDLLKAEFGKGLKRFEYKTGGDRVRLYFQRGYDVTGQNPTGSGGASSPAGTGGGTASGSAAGTGSTAGSGSAADDGSGSGSGSAADDDDSGSAAGSGSAAAVPKKAAVPAKKLAPKKLAPKKVAPKKAMPKKAAPKKAAPKKTAPKKVTPAPKKAEPKSGALQRAHERVLARASLARDPKADDKAGKDKKAKDKKAAKPTIGPANGSASGSGSGSASASAGSSDGSGSAAAAVGAGSASGSGADSDSEDVKKHKKQQALTERLRRKMEDAAKHERIDFKRLRAIFKKAGIKVQNVLQPGRKEDNRYEVILGGLGEDIKKAFGAGVVKDIPQVESVGAKMGQQLRDDGIKSVLYALLLMLIYIAFRFDFRYAPGAVIALAHDVIITTGLFAATWAEFTLPVVAALLTIAGYSINDTIVVFDRIRENVARLRDRKFPLVVNASINETLSRTLLTSLTTLFTCVSIWVVGTGVLKTFAFALTAGVVVGTYSSVLIASPLVVVLNERFARRAKR